jgi:hypothetical protein
MELTAIWGRSVQVAVVGINIMDLSRGMFSMCVRARCKAGLTAIRGQRIRAAVVGINIMNL